jgi:hypothetical protein
MSSRAAMTPPNFFFREESASIQARSSASAAAFFSRRLPFLAPSSTPCRFFIELARPRTRSATLISVSLEPFDCSARMASMSPKRRTTRGKLQSMVSFISRAVTWRVVLPG